MMLVCMTGIFVFVNVGHTTYCVWQEEVYQLWLDVESLYEVRDNIW
ncbi:MAG: hypothetical protein P8183_13860 [Anaerolineae bacterium]